MPSCFPQCHADHNRGFPAAFIGIFFTGAMLIEVMFSLEGIGLLGFESTIQRDYPVVFSSLYIMTLLGLC